jgi:hypothetical protein
VTNTVVTERDFWGGPPPIVRRILRAFPVDDTIAFFRELGVVLHEEADGKLFPDSNRARDVLDALIRETAASGAALLTSHRVSGVERTGDPPPLARDVRELRRGSPKHCEGGTFRIVTPHGDLHAGAVVLATGGQSLPKTGSDGGGFAIARRLGHTLVPTTPALVPLLLDADEAVHRALSGVSHDVELAVWIDGRIATRLTGAMLWTHFGVSGPVALNASRHWMRAHIDQRSARLTVNFCPGESFDEVDARWNDRAREHPRATVQASLAQTLPASVASAIAGRLGIDAGVPLAHFPREDRRRLVRALVEWPLAVTGTRGYNYAEVTAGGIALDEIDPSTMESRVCRGVYLVGEILDVDGRIGGFNFQWAWSTGFVAGRALGGGAARA